MGLSINGQHVYCGDYIYSGHTVILTVSSLLIQEYTPQKWRPLHWLSWTITFFGVVFVMLAHGHYTVDVLIAYYVTTRIFWMYHTMANNTLLKVWFIIISQSFKIILIFIIQQQNGPSNYLARLWWFRIFSYFERNVGGVVPRRYEWPLPWPRNFLSKYPDRDSWNDGVSAINVNRYCVKIGERERTSGLLSFNHIINSFDRPESCTLNNCRVVYLYFTVLLHPDL